jgi:hypothetical protein
MTQAAHRRSTLRFWLAVAAAVEAGDLIAIVGAWTPGRAASRGVALGLGGSAAFAAVILMGTTRPIGRWLGATIRLVLVASLPGADGRRLDGRSDAGPNSRSDAVGHVHRLARCTPRSSPAPTSAGNAPRPVAGGPGREQRQRLDWPSTPNCPEWISAALDIGGP